ncbi:MAG TPA: S8 family serine peptidase [Patescibacteria group bacterium]|nr:S8 family serine peptidase [Patescibacteria group bacterium]
MRKVFKSVGTKSLLVLAILFALSGLRPSLASAGSAPSVRFPHHSNTVLHIKFKDSTNISLTGNNFVGSDAGSINSVLSQSKAQSKQQLFEDSAANLKAKYHAAIASGSNVHDLSQYYAIKISAGQDIQAVSDHLRTLPGIEDAYPEPLPAPSPTTPNYTSMELYRNSAPTGIDANFAATWPGAVGAHARITDVEYSWNVNHEDLSKARAPGASIANGTPVDPFNDNNHGTAVLGMLGGDANTFGVTGLVPNTPINMVNTVSSESGWSVANAVYIASNQMSAGDVMTIEQQSCGPSDPSCTSGFMPIEWIPEVYDAISYATAKNIVVVEPAANGGQNLDDASLYGSPFPSGKPSSGAIIVGAGAACAGGSPGRSRLSFSNYGSRVNMQGLGECVTTTGYGGLSPSTATPNSYYTAYFNGTSSATPTVAGAAASFVSSYKYLNGVAPSVTLVSSVLESTGTPQNYSVGSLTGNIGPLPNLAIALLRTDLKSPTSATKLSAALNASNKVVLKWTAATDNVGVASYKVYRNNVLIKIIAPSTTFTDTTVVAKKTYQYKLVTVDRAGHSSPVSTAVSITTR